MRHGRHKLRATALLPCAVVLLVTPLTSAASAPHRQPQPGGPARSAEIGGVAAKAAGSVRAGTGAVRAGTDAVRDGNRLAGIRELLSDTGSAAGAPVLTTRSAQRSVTAGSGTRKAEKSPDDDGTSAPSPQGGRQHSRTEPGSPPAGDSTGRSPRSERPSGSSASSDGSSAPSGSSDSSGSVRTPGTDRHSSSPRPHHSGGTADGRRDARDPSPQTGRPGGGTEPDRPRGRAERRADPGRGAAAKDGGREGGGNGHGDRERNGHGGDTSVEGGVFGDGEADVPGHRPEGDAPGGTEQEARSPAAHRVSPVLPLGAGLTSIGLGLGLLALRLRRG